MMMKKTRINSFKKFLTNHNLEIILDRIALIWVLIFTIAAALVAVNRYWQFEVFYYDFGIFDSAIWQVSRFQPPVIEHLVIGGKWIFADHFSPGMFLLSPLYWLTDSQEIMLIAQAVAAGISAYVVYLIAKKVIKKTVPALAVLISYCLFVGLQNALITDIHEVVFMLVPLTLTLYAMVTKKQKQMWFWFALILMFKESAFLLGMGLGMFLWWIRKDQWKSALIMFGISIAWGAVVTQYIIPYFSGTDYAYKPDFYRELWKNVWSMVDHPLKRETQFRSLWSFGFLPVISPATWPLIGQDWVVRFVPQNTGGRWTMGMHYSAQLAPLLAVGMAYGLKLVIALNEKRAWYKKQIAKNFNVSWGQAAIIVASGALVLNAVYLHQFKLHGPLGLAYNPSFYEHSKDFGFLEEMIAKVPKNASIMTQNNLASHFTHQQVWLTRDDYEEYNPDYFLFDLRPGQNPNNFFGKTSNIELLVEKIKADQNYEVLFQTEHQFLFVKK